MIAFANELEAVVLAEGIETADELDTLRGLGVDLGQGYLLGSPAPLPA
jgi:EAL domain-containing protein (putative c-di-GMP-specific phosphodiesterase class I)